jgi:hypothetical protein
MAHHFPCKTCNHWRQHHPRNFCTVPDCNCINYVPTKNAQPIAHTQNCDEQPDTNHTLFPECSEEGHSTKPAAKGSPSRDADLAAALAAFAAQVTVEPRTPARERTPTRAGSVQGSSSGDHVDAGTEHGEQVARSGRGQPLRELPPHPDPPPTLPGIAPRDGERWLLPPATCIVHYVAAIPARRGTMATAAITLCGERHALRRGSWDTSRVGRRVELARSPGRRMLCARCGQRAGELAMRPSVRRSMRWAPYSRRVTCSAA